MKATMSMRLLVLSAILLLQGCVTVTDSKSLVIKPQPGETNIVVTSKARAECRDFFFILTCQLYLDITQAK